MIRLKEGDNERGSGEAKDRLSDQTKLARRYGVTGLSGP
jgi:hypothetical protein